jgi:hypothetical protein
VWVAMRVRWVVYAAGPSTVVLYTGGSLMSRTSMSIDRLSGPIEAVGPGVAVSVGVIWVDDRIRSGTRGG